MRREFGRSLCAIALLVLAVTSAARGAPRHRVVSPDESVAVTVTVDADRRLVVEVRRGGREVLAPSPAGVTVDGVDLGAGVTLGGRAARYDVDTRYPHLGHASQIRNRGRGMRVPVRHPRGQWTLEVRAYDDGVAWRYVVPGAGRRRVTGEATAFRLPAAAAYWSHTDTKDYEGQYRRHAASDPVDRTLTMPMTFELPGGGFACLAEADVMHYSGMTLRATGGGRFQAAFEDDAEGWTMDGAFASPWRVCITVDDLHGLVNSTIIYNVAPEPDPALFPRGARTDWIRPGRSMWQWWFYGWDGLAWDRQTWFVDMAAALNCRYYLVDDGWEGRKYGWITDGRSQWDSLRELVTYARGKGVDVWVWRNWKRLEDPTERRDFFRRLSEAGAVGVKIDFMESESHRRLGFYRDALADAARRKLMVNFHGANKSAGESRTWPNEMSREAVYGLEHNKGGPQITLEHYAAVPFTACVGGAKDFTPTTFRRGNAGTTQAFQLATAALYTSPFLCWANRPEELLESPALDLIRTLPTAWDETVVLPGTTIGRFVAFARRDGDDWWVAVINASREARAYDLDLDFLPDGNWAVHAAHDVEGDPWPLRTSTSNVAAGQTVTVKLEPAGGYVARLSRAVARSGEAGE
jgi:alpha-glucosidase